MSNMLKVPAGMLGELRCGLHNVLGQAAEDVSEVTVRQARERHPEVSKPRRTDRGFARHPPSRAGTPVLTADVPARARMRKR